MPILEPLLPRAFVQVQVVATMGPHLSSSQPPKEANGSHITLGTPLVSLAATAHIPEAATPIPVAAIPAIAAAPPLPATPPPRAHAAAHSEPTAPAPPAAAKPEVRPRPAEKLNGKVTVTVS